MKLIKNYLRNTMTDERLSALALMYIHPRIDINIEEVINRFTTNPLSENSCNKLTGIMHMYSELTDLCMTCCL
jgi:hypothetical protein